MLTLLGTSGTTIAVEPSVTGSTLLALSEPRQDAHVRDLSPLDPATRP